MTDDQIINRTVPQEVTWDLWAAVETRGMAVEDGLRFWVISGRSIVLGVYPSQEQAREAHPTADAPMSLVEVIPVRVQGVVNAYSTDRKGSK